MSATRGKIGLLILITLWLAACNSGGAGPGEAMVERVEITTRPGNPPAYAAVVVGYLPDTCTQPGRARQTQVRNTIRVTLNTVQRGANCNPISMPFIEVVPLEVDGLSAGSYAVEVNGVTTSMTLTEDH